MLVLDRKQEIMKLLRKRKSIRVTELSELFYTCQSTIRRDLTDLEKTGFLKRTYGGAVLLEGMEAEAPFLARETDKTNTKSHIGKLAAKLVHEGDVIAMDASTTTLFMIPYLAHLKEFTVITSGAKMAMDLANTTQARIISTGGQMRTRSLTYTGEIAIRTVELFHYDTVFFSCNSITMEDGLYDVILDEIALCHAMLVRAKRKVLLLDDSKFDRRGFCKLCDFAQINYLITNQQPSPKWVEYLRENRVRLLY